MSKPRIFISYDYDNDKHYKNLLVAWDSNNQFDLTFYDESVDGSVDSSDANYIKQVIKKRIQNATHFLCIIGKHTHRSGWVTWEIQTAHSLNRRLVAVKTDVDNTSPEAILNVGASWAKSFTFDSIKRAVDSA